MSISRLSLVFVGAVTAVLPSSAWAQEQAAPPPPPPQNQPLPQNQPPPPPPHRDGNVDGVRFRGGIAAAGGGEFGSGFTVPLFGLEGRLGVQINHLFGAYVQPAFSLGSGSVPGGTGFTGTASVSALADFTIIHRLFIAVGGGAGVLNNPGGPIIHARLGGYPLMGFGENGYTRKGLMIGVDFRLFIVDFAGSTLTPVQVMGSIGYEAF